MAPNPMVGAVVVQGKEVVGEGFHRQAGEPHAEVEALRQAGRQAREATLYLTLEPCVHHGRTPPCTEEVLAAGIRRLVACHGDPDPRVSGRGFESLRRAGVEVVTGPLAREAIRLNLVYLVATVFARPAVTLKWAMSLDGRISTHSGDSQWISGPRGRRWALSLREEHDAVLAGVGTILADDPRLDRRLGKASVPNVRVVLDRRLRTPPQARLFQVAGQVLIYTASGEASRQQALEAAGAEVVHLADVHPEAVLADLHGRGIRSVLVEGGAEILGAFCEAGKFDRVAVDCGPVLIAGSAAPGPLGGVGASRLDQAIQLAEVRTRRRGEDVVIEGYRRECLQALYSRLDA